MPARGEPEECPVEREFVPFSRPENRVARSECRNVHAQHSMHLQNQARCSYRGPLMRFGVFYSAPPFGFPFSFLFPARTFFRFLSLFCAHIGPALSVHVHSYTRPRSEVAQVVLMRYGSSGCSCSLGSFSLQRHALSCLVPISCLHLFVLCTRTLIS